MRNTLQNGKILKRNFEKKTPNIKETNAAGFNLEHIAHVRQLKTTPNQA